jgi:hypothetical protein
VKTTIGDKEGFKSKEDESSATRDCHGWVPCWVGEEGSVVRADCGSGSVPSGYDSSRVVRREAVGEPTPIVNS